MCRFLLQSPRHQSDSSCGARDSQELGALRPAQALRRHREVAEGVSCLRLTALQAWFPPTHGSGVPTALMEDPGPQSSTLLTR